MLCKVNMFPRIYCGFYRNCSEQTEVRIGFCFLLDIFVGGCKLLHASNVIVTRFFLTNQLLTRTKYYHTIVVDKKVKCCRSLDWNTNK